MNNSQSISILKRRILLLVLFISFHLSSYANTVVPSEDKSQPVIIQNTNDYNWHKHLEGNVFWVSNLDHYKMEKYHFHDDYVLITEVDFRDGLYHGKDELNVTYNVTSDGILAIGTGNGQTFYNVTSIIGEKVSTKVRLSHEASEFIDFDDLEFEIALQDGSIGKLVINDGNHNREMPDLFKILDSKGSMVDSFLDISSTVSFIESLDNHQSYPFPKWIELKNKPSIESLRNHQVTNFQTRHFFFDEQKMRDYHLTSAFTKITDGPISYSIPAHWEHTTFQAYYKWGSSSSYQIYSPNGEIVSLSVVSKLFPDNLLDWVKIEKNNFLKEYPTTFQNEDGQFSTITQNFNGTAISHGYHDDYSNIRYNFSIGIDLDKKISGSWLLGQLSANSQSKDSNSYETALHIAQTFDLNHSWSSPQSIDTNNSPEAPFAVIYPDPNAYIPDSRKINLYWYHSDWFNYYFQAENEWIFHPIIGWFHSTANHQTSSVWLYNPQLGWVWTSKEVFPFMFSNVRADWIYFMQPNELFPEYPHFYDYKARSWKDSNEMFTEKEVINQNTINYEQNVVNALDQFIRGK